ncbi:hypothetical protein ACFRQM_15490 [Streptomyces sp. NPDC056831]
MRYVTPDILITAGRAWPESFFPAFIQKFGGAQGKDEIHDR